MLTQWSEVFAPDAVIDASDVGLDAELGLEEFVDFMRGKDRKSDQGLGRLFGLWQHREGSATITVDGDTATAISPFFHTHETRDAKANVIRTGLPPRKWASCSARGMDEAPGGGRLTCGFGSWALRDSNPRPQPCEALHANGFTCGFMHPGWSEPHSSCQE
jgi:hypothetical protein